MKNKDGKRTSNNPQKAPDSDPQHERFQDNYPPNESSRGAQRGQPGKQQQQRPSGDRRVRK